MRLLCRAKHCNLLVFKIREELHLKNNFWTELYANEVVLGCCDIVALHRSR